MAGDDSRYKTDERQRLLGNQKSSTSTTKKGKLEIESQEPVEEKTDDKGATLIVAFVLMLVFQLGNRIFGRLQTYPMHNYPLFLNMLGVVIYIPICYAYIIPAMLFTNNITKEQREIPKYKFAVMGAYDSLAGIMQTFAVNYISNASMIVLVQQSAIPISMVISRYALNSVYTKAQYIGAVVVLLGIVVVLIPNFFGSNEPHVDASSSAPGAGVSPEMEMVWLLVLVVSCVPMCLSSVYKEKALGETEIDVMYLNGWVAIFQFLIAIPLCVPTSMVQSIPVSNIMPSMVGGMKCWAGINSITEDNNPYNQPLDDCTSAPLYVTVYLFFNVVYNFLIVIILKLGSANILWMASTVIVPLSNVAFSLKWMPGHQPLKFWDIMGLLVIMLGLVIYRFSKELRSVWKKITGTTTPDDEEEDNRSRQIAKSAEGKQLKYLGINQTEYLQTFVDTRIMKEKSAILYRSPQQIRSTFLAKIGVPPSPLIAMGPGKRPTIADQDALNAARANYQATGYSPLMRTSSFKDSPSKPIRNMSFKAQQSQLNNNK